MASASKLGSTMLSRVASTAARPTSIPSRTFTTSLAFRARPAAAAAAATNNKPQPRAKRSNPLIGNFASAQPQQEEGVDNIASPAEQPHTPSPSPTPASQIEADQSQPPPPPPPPASSETAQAKTEPSPAKEDTRAHPYTAANSSPPLNLDIASIIANKSAEYGRSLGVGDPLSRPKLRTKAILGHTVFVKDRITPTSAPTPMMALRTLERMCRDQKVRNKFHMQKFHERPGLKKKRLRSQRWRARFKTGFKAAVTRVLELKKQGW